MQQLSCAKVLNYKSTQFAPTISPDQSNGYLNVLLEINLGFLPSTENSIQYWL